MERLDDAYRTLGIPQGSSIEEIRTQWKKLSIQNHPDKVGSNPESNAKMARINDAYDKLITALQAHEFLAQEEMQTHRRRSSGLSPFNSAGQQRYRRSEHTTSAPPKSSKPWPHRKIPTKPPPPDSLRSPPPGSGGIDPKSVLKKHNITISRLLDMQALAKDLRVWIKGQSFTGIHPATYEASGHVVSWFRSEIQMHNKIFYELEGLDSLWANHGDSEKQNYWYIKTIVDGSKDKLEEMHVWLENFLYDFIVIGQKFDEAAEWNFFEKARRFCPEDKAVYFHRRSR